MLTFGLDYLFEVELESMPWRINQLELSSLAAVRSGAAAVLGE